MQVVNYFPNKKKTQTKTGQHLLLSPFLRITLKFYPDYRAFLEEKSMFCLKNKIKNFKCCARLLWESTIF